MAGVKNLDGMEGTAILGSSPEVYLGDPFGEY